MSTTTKCGCLTGAEAYLASWGVLLPSTRAFGHVPLTGEVDQPRRRKRAPVSPEMTNKLVTDQQPRCEIGKVLMAEGECRRLGEVQLDGSLVCTAHAEMLRLEGRSETMLGEVFKMDEWLDSVDGEADEVRVRRAEHHRNELVERLRFNRAHMAIIRDELYKRRTMMD